MVSLSEQPLSLGLSKACVRRAALLITTDSGPRHFAAAFQTPVITLFGPTHIAWTRTYHPRALHLFHPVPCGPCQRPICPEGHHRCMRELTPDQVLRATLSLLGTEEAYQEPQASWFGTRNMSQRIGGPSPQPRRRGGTAPARDNVDLPGQKAEIDVMATWLITGATGFLGRHVLDVLDSELVRDRSNRRRRPRAGTALSRRVGRSRALSGPIWTIPIGLREAIGKVVPDHVIHTAGQTPPAPDDALYREQFLGDDPSAQRLAQLEPPGARDAGRFRCRAGARSSLRLAGCRVVSLQPARRLWPQQAARHDRRPGGAAAAGAGRRPRVQSHWARNASNPGFRRVCRSVDGRAWPTPCRSWLAISRPAAISSMSGTWRGPWSPFRSAASPVWSTMSARGQSRSVGEGLDLLVRLSGRSVKVCVDPRRHVRKGPADSRADIRRIVSHTGWTTDNPLRAKPGRPVERPEKGLGQIQPRGRDPIAINGVEKPDRADPASRAGGTPRVGSARRVGSPACTDLPAPSGRVIRNVECRHGSMTGVSG